MNHYKLRCPWCGTGTQCRCPSPSKAVESRVCEECKQRCLICDAKRGTPCDKALHDKLTEDIKQFVEFVRKS